MKLHALLACRTQAEIDVIMLKKDKDRSDEEKKVYKQVRYLSWIDFDKRPARERGTDLRPVSEVLASINAKEATKAAAKLAEQTAALAAARSGQTVPLSELTTPGNSEPLIPQGEDLSEEEHERRAAEWGRSVRGESAPGLIRQW
jgi:hypothetical protein